MKISTFMEQELVNYASYDNLRSIASYIDGQKNTARKILYTVLKKNINQELKVSQLSSKMAEFTQYLHGDASGVIVSMAQNYVGTNNLPLLAREGNFGTRFKPEASAPRYIYTMKDKHTDMLFNKDDEDVLIKQFFEGDEIEPRFYAPTLPLLLINGSMNCMTPGFYQHVMPRKMYSIKEYVERRLKNEDVSDIDLTPHFEGFNGKIVPGPTPNKWEVQGTFERVGNAGIRITELPTGWDLKKYNNFLESLIDKKIIRSFRDRSEKDKFIFEVQVDSKFIGLSDEKIMERLKLVKKETEHFNAIDENNRMRSFEGIHEILEAFITLKKEYIQKRKTHQLNTLKDKMNLEASKYIFIKSINDGVIVINKKSKQEIVDQIVTVDRIIPKDGSYDYLLNISIYKLTTEEMEKAKNSIMTMKSEYKDLAESSVEQIWLRDL
jgi:DNA gyrase/topoisomerase IV subunit A